MNHIPQPWSPGSSEPYEHGTYNRKTGKVVPKGAIVIENWGPGPTHLSSLLDLLRENYWRELADQIEAQTKPPRIPEPDLYGLVKAGPPHDRRVWVRGPKGWTMVDAPGRYLNWNHWDNLENPERL